MQHPLEVAVVVQAHQEPLADREQEMAVLEPHQLFQGSQQLMLAVVVVLTMLRLAVLAVLAVVVRGVLAQSETLEL